MSRFSQHRFTPDGSGTRGLRWWSEAALAAALVVFVSAAHAVVPIPPSALFTEHNSGLPTNEVNALLTDDAGRLWVGTEGRGLVVLDGARWRRIAIPAEPARDASRVHALARDPRGFIWAATARGLLSGQGGRWRLINRNAGTLPSSYVSTVYVDGSGSIWAGTEEGLASLRDGVWSLYTATAGGLPDRHVNVLAEGSDGTLWVGTRNGLAAFGGQRWRPVALPGAYRDVRALATFPDGTLWVGTTGGLARRAEGGWTTYGEGAGLPDQEITCLLPGSDGSLWVGTRGGLVRLHLGRFIRYALPVTGSAHREVTALAAGPPGRIWAATWHGIASVATALPP